MSDLPQNDVPLSTHDALLDAAEALFGEHGYAGVGIREIADRARANIAAIKYHFGGKSELYLACVRRSMSRSDAASAWAILAQPPGDRAAAAEVLARFIHAMIGKLLQSAESEHCCGLMLREAAEPSEAIDAVVRDFIQPHHRSLMNLIAVIAPNLDECRRSCAATSVLSQIFHLRIFRPFLERIEDCRRQTSDLEYAATRIGEFSLRGLGCEEEIIRRAIAATHPSALATR